MMKLQIKLQNDDKKTNTHTHTKKKIKKISPTNKKLVEMSKVTLNRVNEQILIN